MNKIFIITLSVLGVMLGGCVIASKLGTPGRNEKSVPAEFDLSEHDSGKVLIIVRGGNESRETERLGYNIYAAAKGILLKKEIIKENNLIDYRYYINFKNSRDISYLSVFEIGQQLGADTVLEMVIEDYNLTRLPGTNYYEGSLKLGGLVHDVEKRWALWPEDGFTKQVTVGFDVDNSGYEGAIKRLAAAGSHCITRYLYDCKLNNFKIFDENTNSQW